MLYVIFATVEAENVPIDAPILAIAADASEAAFATATAAFAAAVLIIEARLAPIAAEAVAETKIANTKKIVRKIGGMVLRPFLLLFLFLRFLLI